jgi:predicted nucleic acid-binding protein
MTLYAESSAVLAWFLGESAGREVQHHLVTADFVVTSDLTLVECDRAFHRAHLLGEISSDRFLRRREKLAELTAGWILLRLSPEIIRRARGHFPGKPIRSLDALHLASALHAIEQGDALLTLDQRIRECAEGLGLHVLPGSG